MLEAHSIITIQPLQTIPCLIWRLRVVHSAEYNHSNNNSSHSLIIMSRISGIVSTPVSDRIKIFDSSPQTPKRIPVRSQERPAKEKVTLETPKLRPVPRQQFPAVTVPASVKPYLNPKLSSPAVTRKTAPVSSLEIPKVDLKPVKSETAAKTEQVKKTSVTRSRSISTAR